MRGRDGNSKKVLTPELSVDTLEKRLKDHLTKKYITISDGTKHISLARQCGKTQTILAMVEREIALTVTIQDVSRRFSTMPLDQLPLYVNHEDFVQAEAAKWRLKNE